MSRPRRLDRANYLENRWYFLTICTYRRRPAFTAGAMVAVVLAQFLRVARDEQFELLAYCFMPDHLHAVVVARSDAADLHRFVRLAKQRSGYAFTRATGLRLWQESYFDRAIRRDQSLPDIVAYMLRNPVRARLAAASEEYPYWGSQIYSREEVLQFVSAERRV